MSINIIKKKHFPFKEISFRASGWMLVFYFGVVKYINEHFKIKGLQLTGSSGGAVAACGLLCDMNLDEIISYLEEKNKKTNVFGICDLTKNGIDSFIKNISDKKLKRNTLNIACTIFEGKNYRTHLFNKFDSVIDICNYLKGSVHIPFFGGITPYKYNNYSMYDSIITDSHPHISNDCLKISWTKKCKCGCEKSLNHIRPYPNIPLTWCMSPPEGVITELYHHGYFQAKLFFENVHDDNDVKIIESIQTKLVEYDNKINNLKIGCTFAFVMVVIIKIKHSKLCK